MKVFIGILVFNPPSQSCKQILQASAEEIAAVVQPEPTANQKSDVLVNLFQGGSGAEPEVTKVTRFQSNTKSQRSRRSTPRALIGSVGSVGLKFQHCT